MKTGTDIVRTSGLTSHMGAIITGATTVLMQDLTRDFYRLSVLTGDTDHTAMMRSCAYRFLLSDRCARLQAIVDDFMSSADETPVVEDQEMLEEILAVYEPAEQAARAGNLNEFRTDTLVPCVQMHAVHSSSMPDNEATEFLRDINANREAAEQFVPHTAFEKIVYSCINSGHDI